MLQRVGALFIRKRASSVYRESTRQHSAGDDQNIQGVLQAQTIFPPSATRPFETTMDAETGSSAL
jgi:hypothetical protein